ncbi:MAG: hypothetical protein ACRDOI_24680 [Trebonia sp.]
MDRPRVGVKSRPHGVLVSGLDGQQRKVPAVPAADRAAEDDDPAADELVSESGVPVPEGLLADVPGVIPARMPGRRDGEYRHRSSLQSAAAPTA